MSNIFENIAFNVISAYCDYKHVNFEFHTISQRERSAKAVEDFLKNMSDDDKKSIRKILRKKKNKK